MARGKDEAASVVIRKYANRRLYNTATSTYVTLEDLCKMVKDGVDFVVHDARSGEDITRAALTQIILDQESKGENLLPIGFLRQLIGYYDDRLRALVPSYLEVAMENFADNQTWMRRNLENTFGEIFPVQTMQELGERNMATFQRALSMFGPFARGGAGAGEAAPAERPAPEPPRAARAPAGEIAELRAQLARMQARIDALSHGE